MAKTLLSEGFVAEASCNGLICFHKDNRMVICDPITETSATIDDSTVHLPCSPGEYTRVLNVQLLYDLKVSTDFKIVKTWFNYCRLAFFHVFSSRDGSWRVLREPAPFDPLHFRDFRGYVASSCVGEEGAMCWLEEHGNSYECIVRVYELGTGSLWELPLPPFDPWKQRGQTKFMGKLVTSVSGGKVYLMRVLKKKIVMWRLDGKERRWTLEFDGSKTLEAIDDVFSPPIHNPLAYDAEERKVIMGAEEYTVQSYDLLNSKTELIALDVGFFWHQNVVLHWNKPAPFSICRAALVQS